MKRIALSVLFALAATQASAFEVGDHAACVVLPDVQTDGTTVSQCIRTKEPGKSYVLLEFFSATCSDCAANLPLLSKLASEISPTTTTRLVGIDRSEADLRAYVDGHRDLIHFPVALDFERDAKKTYGVTATPTIFILDSNNQVIYKLVDVFNDEQLALVKSLVLH